MVGWEVDLFGMLMKYQDTAHAVDMKRYEWFLKHGRAKLWTVNS